MGVVSIIQVALDAGLARDLEQRRLIAKDALRHALRPRHGDAADGRPLFGARRRDVDAVFRDTRRLRGVVGARRALLLDLGRRLLLGLAELVVAEPLRFAARALMRVV